MNKKCHCITVICVIQPLGTMNLLIAIHSLLVLLFQALLLWYISSNWLISAPLQLHWGLKSLVTAINERFYLILYLQDINSIITAALLYCPAVFFLPLSLPLVSLSRDLTITSVNISAFQFTTNSMQTGSLLRGCTWLLHVWSHHMLEDHYHCLDSLITVLD